MKNIFKDKFLLILFAFILFFCNFCTSEVSATDDSTLFTTLPSINEYIGENDKWLIYWNPLEQYYFLVVYDGNITYCGHYWGGSSEHPEEFTNPVHDENNFYIYYSSGSVFRRYQLIDNVWVLKVTDPTVSRPTIYNFDILSNICAINFDLRNNTNIFNNNDVVFQKSPTLSTLKGINLNQMAWEMVKGIMAIMMMVIGLVIFLIGLRKAFQILVNGLRT